MPPEERQLHSVLAVSVPGAERGERPWLILQHLDQATIPPLGATQLLLLGVAGASGGWSIAWLQGQQPNATALAPAGKRRASHLPTLQPNWLTTGLILRMRSVGAFEAKTHLAALLDAVSAGDRSR